MTLSLVPESGGAVTELPLGTAIGPARWPEFLPDGRQLLLQVRSPDPEKRGIYLRALDQTNIEPRRLVGSDFAARYASGHLLFLENGRLLAQTFDADRGEVSGTPMPVTGGVGTSTNGYAAFSVSTTGVLAYAGPLSGVSELRWVNRSGQPAEMVSPAGDYVDFRLSNDQSRLAYARVDPQSEFPDVWVLDFARKTSARVTTERLTDASAVWSPNGEQLVFRSNRGTSSGNDLFLTASAPGGVARQIYGGGPTGTIIPCCWAADGSVAFFQIAPASVANGYGIWRVDVETGAATTVLDTVANELQPALSLDGRWMAYASDQSGHYEIHVREYPDGNTPTVVSTDGGMQPQWRADGHELYYLQGDGSLMAVTVSPGARFNASAPTRIFKAPGVSTVLNPFRMDYVPAKDGQRFLMRIPVDAEKRAGITVILNWPALLKK